MEDINKKIAAESKTILELEASYPKHVNSLDWHAHHTKLRDAYWRRRMLFAKRNREDQTETAKVY